MTRQPGTQIDQPTVSARNHSWHNGLRCQERGTQLAVQLAAELLPAQLGERGDDKRRQRVVHEHVRPTPPPIDFIDHGGDVVRHGDVGFNRHRFAAGRGDGRNHLLGLWCTGAVVHDHPVPVFGQYQCGCRTDSPAGSRD
jgi:hypothetical protein